MGGLVDLAEVERAIQAAIRSGDSSGLNLLGHGEVSIVLGWPTAAPSQALKRVPPFASAAVAQQYVTVCERNFEILRAAGVALWPTELRTLQRGDGKVVVYHSQPIADASLIGSNVLRAAKPAASHPLLDAIVRSAAAVVTPTIGFDVQVANWLWDGETATQLDFTSPFLLHDTRDDLLFETAGFLGEYPAIARRYLRRELTQSIVRFTTPAGAIGDMIANLHKEGLQQWVEPALRSAEQHAGVVIDPAQPLAMYTADLKLMPLALRLRKTQRAWRRATGRQYDALLPERTTYDRGPVHR